MNSPAVEGRIDREVRRTDAPRWLRSGNAPSHHEWRRWADGLWRCPWCDGFHASEEMPRRNAPAMNNAEAATYGIQYA